VLHVLPISFSLISVPASQKTHCISFTNISLLMLRQNFALCCGNQTKWINACYERTTSFWTLEQAMYMLITALYKRLCQPFSTHGTPEKNAKIVKAHHPFCN
jgi:hypothetical protein